MRWWLGLAVLVSALPSCRGYDLNPRLTQEEGLVSADEFAAYGGEQAQLAAIGRRFRVAYQESSGDPVKPAEIAMAYARTLPDVVDVTADPHGLLLTVRFKSGWRTMTSPIVSGEGVLERVRPAAEAAP